MNEAIRPLTVRIAGRDYPVTITKTSSGFEYRCERNAEEFWGCCRTLAGAVIEAREALQCWGDEPESAEEDEMLEMWLQASVAVARGGRKVA